MADPETMPDVVDALQSLLDRQDLTFAECSLAEEWADAASVALAEITRLRAERDALRTRVKTLEGALNPFADEADRYDPVEDDDQQQLWLADSDLCIGHLRAARAARAALKEKNDGQG